MWEEELYSEGRHLNRYPYDQVVTFLFRNAPPRPRQTVRVIEVGCGAGNNLWFAAREGFTVCGIDGSPSAIAFARKRFADEGLTGDLRVGDFTSLPFPDESADLAFDRGALTCAGFEAATRAIAEIRRVLSPGGRFLFTPFSTRHTSCHARDHDGLVSPVTTGDLAGLGQICFYDEGDIATILGEGWQVLGLELQEISDRHTGHLHAVWCVTSEKLG